MWQYIKNQWQLIQGESKKNNPPKENSNFLSAFAISIGNFTGMQRERLTYSGQVLCEKV